MGVMTQPYTTVLPAEYGNGNDGDLIVSSGTVTIQSIYEDDTVSGVTTMRGTNKGLNKGSGSYNKDTGKIPNFRTVLVESGATLSGVAYSSVSAREGNICFRATDTVFINGSISATALGYRGGYSMYGNQLGGYYAPTDGNGPGHGHAPGSDGMPDLYPPGAAGATYGDNATLTMGSGGGGAAYPGGENPGVQSGGHGGGAIQIFARKFIFGTSGEIIAAGGVAPWATGSRVGMGGSGSGGHIILKSLWASDCGTNKITALGGAGISATQSGFSCDGAGSAGYGTAGSAGSYDTNAVIAGGSGRIRLYGSWSGTTSPAAA